VAYKSLHFKITGVAPLLMHNGQLADPLNDHSKALKRITSKRNKTDADHEEMARLEWFGSLYLKDGKPCLPGEILEAAFVAAAKKQKQGKQAQAGIFCPDSYPLLYDGARKPEQLWGDRDYRHTVGVRVQQNRVSRTRPIFRNWSCKIEVQYDDELLNAEEVNDIVRIAGEIIGVGDWRPKYGRFKVG
jgi:hypothetical protein